MLLHKFRASLEAKDTSLSTLLYSAVGKDNLNAVQSPLIKGLHPFDVDKRVRPHYRKPDQRLFPIHNTLLLTDDAKKGYKFC